MSALWFASALLAQGWARRVRVELGGGRILRVQDGVEPEAGDERHAIALPGLPNVHSHAFQRAMAGLAESAGAGADSFWSWRAAMYRYVDAIGPQELEAIAACAYMEMLESGFTRVGEFHYLHRDPAGRPYADPAELMGRIVAAARETGIALTLLPVMYAHSNFGGLAPEPAQRRFVNTPEEFARLFEVGARSLAGLADGVVGVAPHSLRAVTPDELRSVVALAPRGPVHIHVAEQIREVEDCLAWSGRRPVEWLLENAEVDERWCLVHATHLTEEETRRLAASGAVAGLCPVTEANLGDGVFPARAYLEWGGAFGVGSDSNVLIGPTEELRMLEYAQRLLHRRRNVLASADRRSTGRRLYEAAHSGGARALGVPAAGLHAGAPADIVTLDAAHPALAGRKEDEILDSWIFAARDPLVDCVWRGGRKVVSAGRHVARDAIAAVYRRIVQRLGS